MIMTLMGYNSSLSVLMFQLSIFHGKLTKGPGCKSKNTVQVDQNGIQRDAITARPN